MLDVSAPKQYVSVCSSERVLKCIWWFCCVCCVCICCVSLGIGEHVYGLCWTLTGFTESCTSILRADDCNLPGQWARGVEMGKEPNLHLMPLHLVEARLHFLSLSGPNLSLQLFCLKKKKVSYCRAPMQRWILVLFGFILLHFLSFIFNLVHSLSPCPLSSLLPCCWNC